ncbi:MAG: sulfite exporter TauE/SafE family protein [Oscillospiraceae bacterium]|nr:sulfite exporter TauE/SafE family protein [Oscillospiraceae bacterium]
MKKGKLYYSILGMSAGLANGLFGSGGGIIAVPMLQKADLPAKKSHASSLALTLPLSIVSAVFYAYKDSLNFSHALPLLPFGLLGAVIGALWLKKIPNTLLKRVFGLLLITAGGRILLS